MKNFLYDRFKILRKLKGGIWARRGKYWGKANKSGVVIIARGWKYDHHSDSFNHETYSHFYIDDANCFDELEVYDSNVSYIHQLKIWPQYFKAVFDGTKTFEIRDNDRHYQEGQIVCLKEYDPAIEKYTGREVVKRIGFLTDYNQKPNYVVFSILDLK